MVYSLSRLHIDRLFLDNSFDPKKIRGDEMKKILILSTLGVVSTAALAGNTTTTHNKSPIPVTANTSRGIYVEGLAGYNRYAFLDALDGIVPSSAVPDWSNSQGNASLAADVGYQFHRNVSAEVGGIYTFKATLRYTYEDESQHKVDIQPWYMYLAAKLSIPVHDNLSVFAKVGAGYQHINISYDDDSLDLDNNSSNWGPMLGLGVAYNLTSTTYANAEWLLFTGKVDDAGVATVSPNVFLVGIGYKFNL
jgi:opacity protein-like surface antigen